jgi:hypothetical protein
MSNTGTGAASAAPILDGLAIKIRNELAAIEEDNQSALTHALRAGELLTQAKGQCSHGEWLPWLHSNFPGHQTTAADYMRLAANKVHALNFKSIREALAAIPQGSPRKPRQKTKTRDGLWQNEDVVAWIRKRRKAGQTRTQMVAAAKAGEHGWPLDKPLPQNTVDIVLGILDDRDTRTEPTKPKRGPTQGGKRKRQLYDEIRQDGDTRLRRLQVDIASAVQKLEHMELPDDIGLTEESQDYIGMLFEDLMNLQGWVETSVTATVACMGDMEIRRKIRTLQHRAQDPSSAPNERAMAARAAERLQKKHRAALEPS